MHDVVKLDVEALGAMLDDLLSDPGPSPYEDLEPDPEYLQLGGGHGGEPVLDCGA